jgi:hypothetical protein
MTGHERAMAAEWNAGSGEALNSRQEAVSMPFRRLGSGLPAMPQAIRAASKPAFILQCIEFEHKFP